MKKDKVARQYIYMFPLKDYIPTNKSTELLYNSYETRNKPRIFEGDDEKTIVTNSITWGLGESTTSISPVTKLSEDKLTSKYGVVKLLVQNAGGKFNPNSNPKSLHHQNILQR